MTRAKKSFGQHFLRDKSVIAKIVAAAEIASGERVVEIGPGTGVLTRALVEAGARVTAIEADRDLIQPLRKQFGDAIELIEGDALQKIDALPDEPYKLVANLPYNVGTEIIERILKSPHPPTRLVVMLQREVAERMMAKPGDMSLLSAAIQMYGSPKRVVNAKPGAFHPPPKVDSTVIRLDVAPKTADPEAVIAVAKRGFRFRRKQLHRNLDIEPAKLAAMGIPSRARPQDLSIEQWILLSTMRK